MINKIFCWVIELKLNLKKNNLLFIFEDFVDFNICNYCWSYFFCNVYVGYLWFLFYVNIFLNGFYNKFIFFLIKDLKFISLECLNIMLDNKC